MSDEEVTALTVWGEARGEPFGGKVAVAWVIRNRVEKGGWWGDTYETVCKKPWQFTCWHDHNKDKMLSVKADDPMYMDSLDAARGAIGGQFPDPTGGATHYFNPDVVAAPKWALSATETVRIGNHLFFKGVA